jgi:Flp pilus assembly protein TadB
MNKYVERAEQKRRAGLRFSLSLWTAGLALVVVALLILGLTSSAAPRMGPAAAIILAIVLLVVRQLSRRQKTKGPRAAQPDPKSTIKLS